MSEAAVKRGATMVSRRDFVLRSLAGALLAASPEAMNGLASARSGRPNIVFILADDMGVADSSIYGQKKFSTPHIDWLASEGLRFTDAYTGAAVCSPSRCALMTGLNTGHGRIRGNFALAGGIVGKKFGTPTRRTNILPQDKTVADYLRAAGYHTGLIGKWHLDGYDPEATPENHGFDEFKGWLVQDDASQEYYPTDRYHNQTVIPIHQNDNGRHGLYETDICITDACDFIRRNAEQPFFLYLAFNSPHAPYVPPTVAEFAGKDWTQDQKSYATMVEFVDSGVGQVIDTLKAAGIDDETIVIFASDNGAPHMKSGLVEFFESNGAFRGYKSDLYEGGIRAPFIIRWPGHIARGTSTNVPIYFPDFLPTALSFAGTSVPAGGDGIDLTPLILHGRRPAERYLYWERFEPYFSQAARHGRWKAVRPRLRAPLELYDLSTDISEKHDVAAQNSAVVASFEKYFKTARTESLNWPLSAAAKGDGPRQEPG